MWVYRHRCKQTDSKTDRQTGKQIDRQIDRYDMIDSDRIDLSVYCLVLYCFSLSVSFNCVLFSLIRLQPLKLATGTRSMFLDFIQNPALLHCFYSALGLNFPWTITVPSSVVEILLESTVPVWIDWRHNCAYALRSHADPLIVPYRTERSGADSPTCDDNKPSSEFNFSGNLPEKGPHDQCDPRQCIEIVLVTTCTTE